MAPATATVRLLGSEPSATRFDKPCDVAVDDTGTVYVAELSRGRGLRKIENGVVSSVSVAIEPLSSPWLGGVHDYAAAWPSRLCVDHSGNLYAIYSDSWDIADAVRLGPLSDGSYSGKAILADPTIVPPSAYNGGTPALGIAVDAKNRLIINYGPSGVLVRFSDGVLSRLPIGTEAADAVAAADLAVGAHGEVYALPGNTWGASDGTVQKGVLTSSDVIAGRLVNLSARAVAGSGEAMLIVGFVLSGRDRIADRPPAGGGPDSGQQSIPGFRRIGRPHADSSPHWARARGQRQLVR